MLSINNETKSLTIINKSKFYCIIAPLNNIDDVDIILNRVKEEYKGATHYCFAYIFNQIKRFDDDKEPSGTAGMPILNVLESNNLNHIIAIVVRYFGGIKLGAGGLVRAYTNSVTKSIEEAKIIEIIKGIKVKILFNYTNLKDIDYILKDISIEDKIFEDNISYIINCNKEFLDKIKIYLIDYEILEEVMIKKS